MKSKNICAVVKQNKVVFKFDTPIQCYVENFMIELGYGGKYFLHLGLDTDDTKSFYKGYFVTLVHFKNRGYKMVIQV